MTNDNSDEIEQLQNDLNLIKRFSESDDSWGGAEAKIRARIEHLEDEDSTDSVSIETSEETQQKIEELERDYDRYSRASEGNTQSSKVWRNMADATREELVSIKTEQLQALAEAHDSIKPGVNGSQQTKARIGREYDALEAEVEELSGRDQ